MIRMRNIKYFGVLFFTAVLLSQSVTAETLKVGRVAGAPSLGNPFTTVGHPSSGVWSAMFDGLTRIGQTGQLEPALALSWEAVAPTRWVFKLRPGVTFHNGAPFNAQSVVGVIAYLQSEEGKRSYIGGEVSGITSVRTIDPLTVEINTAKPDPLLAKSMNLVYMAEPDAIAKMGMDAFAKAPIGTGSFQFVSWGNANSRNVFAAYPASWRKSESVSRLELLGIADASARLQALMSGQIDIMEGIGMDEMPSLDPDAFNIIIQSTPAVISLAFRNIGNPTSPVQDVRVRKALSLAVNRKAIAEKILGDVNRAATQGTVAEAVGYNPEINQAYDPVKAKALLAEAGYAKGFPLQIEVITGFGGADNLIYQQVSQDFLSVGIKAELRAIPFPNWLQKFTYNDWGPVDMFSFVWDATMYYDPIRPIRNSSCSKPTPFYCSPDVMPLLEASNIEMDEAKRADIMRQLMARLHDDASAIWIVDSAVNLAAAKRVSNVRWRSAGLEYEAIKLAK